MTTATINLSQKKYSQAYFDNLMLNPGDCFIKLRTAHIEKEIVFSDIRQFNKEIVLCRAALAGTLKVEIGQRKGYKNVIFIAL